MKNRKSKKSLIILTGILVALSVFFIPLNTIAATSKKDLSNQYHEDIQMLIQDHLEFDSIRNEVVITNKKQLKSELKSLDYALSYGKMRSDINKLNKVMSKEKNSKDKFLRKLIKTQLVAYQYKV